jgi:phosphohistidine phosphatase
VKQLLILRHAKSDWGQSPARDWERPLSPRGINDAPRVGQMLRERCMLPDVILTSDAVRARCTAETAAKAAGYTREIVLEPSLYLATPDAIITLLNNLADANAGRVMIVGHNPGLEDLLEHLTGEHHAMPTAALVQLDLAVGRWSDLTLSPGATVGVCWRPKE